MNCRQPVSQPSFEEIRDLTVGGLMMWIDQQLSELGKEKDKCIKAGDYEGAAFPAERIDRLRDDREAIIRQAEALQISRAASPGS